MRELCFDISAWQGGINYQAIRERVNYCILRAGYSNSKDKCFEEHYNNLQGLNLGAYWYSYATTVEGARQEARTFLEVIRGKKFTLPLYLDIEDPSQAGLGRGTLDAMVRAFGEEIENAGYYFGVYTNLNWYNNIISGRELNNKYDWWIACWSDTAPSTPTYGLWQFTSDYNDFGTRLDANYVLYDYPQIIKENHLNHLDDEPTPTPPSPTPTPSHKIEVDGIWGVDTTRKAQEVFGTYVDGIVSNQLIWWKDENPGLLSSTFEWSNGMYGGSELIRAIQRKVGTYEDGYIGEDTISAMQRWLGTPVDGVASYPSAMISAFQNWLNQQ